MAVSSYQSSRLMMVLPDGVIHAMTRDPLVSVVLPCLNEAAALGGCLEKIQRVFARDRIDGEIVVCDNGSTDGSAAIAERLGARVVREPERGYGNAYLTGFTYARGRYLIMADADGTYDFDLIPRVLELLTTGGYDFVTGSRYLSLTGSRHITFSHRFLGNPLLTAILNYLFNVHYTDVYCGYRGFSRAAYETIRPVSTGMEFNLELAINAWRAGLKITELPIELGPRLGASKLSTLRDGWRSVRMMLLYSPNKIFFWPGALLLAAGVLLHLLLLGYQPTVADAGTSSVLAIIFSALGYWILALGLTAKTYSWANRFEKENAFLRSFYHQFKLETGLVLGLASFLAGGLILGWHLTAWYGSGGARIPPPEWVAFAATLMILGFQTVFFSLFISAMSMKKGGRPA